MKKKLHNGKRSGKAESARGEENSVEESKSADADKEPVDETMVKHLQMTLSMIEGRKVSRAEIVQLIDKMRQRSIDNDKQVRYLGGERKNKPG
jgi:hypothetical protein